MLSTQLIYFINLFNIKAFIKIGLYDKSENLNKTNLRITLQTFCILNNFEVLKSRYIHVYN